MPDTIATRHDDVEVRPSPVHGRGVYARRALAPGETVATSPALVLDEDETAQLAEHRVSHYLVTWDATGSALPLGAVGFVNHDLEPNAELVVDHDHTTVELLVRRPVRAGEELTVDYGPDHVV